MAFNVIFSKDAEQNIFSNSNVFSEIYFSNLQKLLKNKISEI
jgi:hypothetical protein